MFGFFKKTTSISTDDLKQQLTKSINLIDVRTPSEFKSGHIPQAKNIPLNKIKNYQQKNTSEKIYLICQSGMRSKQAANILKKQGYEVVNVRGGMNNWNATVRSGK